MSHHFVTVCVVCVLCATHTPCSAHTDIMIKGEISHDFSNAKNLPRPKQQIQSSWILVKAKETTRLKGPVKINMERFNKPENNDISFTNVQESNVNKRVINPLLAADMSYSEKRALEQKKKDKNSLETHETDVHDELVNDLKILDRLGQIELMVHREQNSADVKNSQNHVNKLRKKRDIHIDEKYFMKKIFEAYGDGTSITMEGFEKLLKKLGLLRLLTGTSKLESPNTNFDRPEKQLDVMRNLQNNGLHDSDSAIAKDRCLNSKELLSTVTQDIPYDLINNNSTTLPSWLFERVCPALVYQLAGESSSERNGCIRVPDNYKPITTNNDYHSEESTRNMVQVWLYSTISILIISLCGLLGVAVIPVMGKSYYHQLLQFLVALAVGTLCGDALIHLLPHAMMSPLIHDDNDHNHKNSNYDYNHGHDHIDVHENNPIIMMNHEQQHNLNMWKGLVAMIGLILFFFTEKALMMVAEWRKHRQRRSKLPSRVRVMRETDGPNSNVVGEKLCKHKYSSYPYCYGEITTETQENHHNRQHNHHERPPIIEEEKPLTANCNSVAKIMTSDIEKKTNDDWRLDDSIVINAKKNADEADVPLNETESYTVIIREHETEHHGHTHSHGHVHSAPESMSSVAWMVVMGDGLHNFTDGMAIGAAFAANIAGGFSTAIAVFCHELPHELGDFAVLLKAGMSAKQAVFYNLLSSVLCLFGMVFGVLLGSSPTATSWMFSAAAGMFIYIALVDMIPELSSSHSTEHGSHWQCILQGLGLFLGLGIMLIIALYEHDLKHIFND